MAPLIGIRPFRPFAGAPHAAAAGNVLRTGNVAYYKLDEATGATALDATGNGHTLADHATVGTAAGVINGSRSFNGTTQYLSGTLAQPSTFTLAGWFYASSLPATATPVAGWSGDTVIPSMEHSGSIGVKANGTIEAVLADNVGARFATSTATVAINAWHHVALVVVPGAAMTLYLDGSVAATQSIGTPYSSWTAGPFLSVGNPDNTYPNWFAGRIDEIGAWSRALSSVEVSALYGGGSGLAYGSFGGGVTAISSSDSGTAAEGTPSILAVVGSSDSGAGAESIATLLAVTGSADSATGTDSGSIFAGLALSSSDSGSGAESSTLAAALAAAESGAGIDTSSLLASTSGADSGTGADSGSVFAGLSLSSSDSGAGTEGTPTILSGLAQTETGSGADASSLLASTSGTDSGTGADSGSIFAGLSISSADSGAGTEATLALAVVLASAETGAGLDASTLASTLAVSDSGAGTDSGSVFAGLTLSSSDSGAGAEGTPSLLASSSSADAGAGADSTSLAATLAGTDSGSGSGSGSESSTLLSALARSDSGTGADSGSIEDVTGSITIQVASADAGAGHEATVAIAAALADAEGSTGADNGWVLAATVDAPYRDRQLLRLLADALQATGEFDEVLTSGLPEDRGRTASDLRLACLELDGWQDADHWGDFDSTEQVRTVSYHLHLLVRADDPDLRDDEVDRLVAVAANTLNGIPLGDVSVPNKTRLLKGKWQPAVGPERRMAIAGQFTYTIPDFDRHTSAEDA